MVEPLTKITLSHVTNWLKEVTLNNPLSKLAPTSVISTLVPKSAELGVTPLMTGLAGFTKKPTVLLVPKGVLMRKDRNPNVAPGEIVRRAVTV